MEDEQVSQAESVKGQVGIRRPKRDTMVGWIWVAAEMKRRQILEDKINKIWWMIRYEGKKRDVSEMLVFWNLYTYIHGMQSNILYNINWIINRNYL